MAEMLYADLRKLVPRANKTLLKYTNTYTSVNKTSFSAELNLGVSFQLLKNKIEWHDNLGLTSSICLIQVLVYKQNDKNPVPS